MRSSANDPNAAVHSFFEFLSNVVQPVALDLITLEIRRMRQGLMREARQRLLAEFINGREIKSRDHRAIIATLLVRT